MANTAEVCLFHKKRGGGRGFRPSRPYGKQTAGKNRLDLTYPHAEKTPVPLRSTENDQRDLRQKKHRRFPIRETSAHTPAYPYTTERAPAVGDPLLCKSSDSRRGELSSFVTCLLTDMTSAMTDFRPSGSRRLGTFLRLQCRSRGALHPVPLKPPPDPHRSRCGKRLHSIFGSCI